MMHRGHDAGVSQMNEQLSISTADGHFTGEKNESKQARPIYRGTRKWPSGQTKTSQRGATIGK